MKKGVFLLWALFSLFGIRTGKAFETTPSVPWTDSINVDETKLHSHSTMLGIGYRNSLDTYLSPEQYNGIEFRLIRENRRMTKLMDRRISVQNLMQGNFAYTKSPTQDGKELSGLFDWNITWHYNWNITPQLTLLAGTGMGIHGGFTYNTRNGNNPAQARLSTDIVTSGMAIYDLNIAKRIVTIRYQADIPIIGAMFSPNYGQSYYEIFSLGNYDHNVCITNLFQALTFNQLLTIDVPFSTGTLRVGYLGAIRQNKVNNLKQHEWSHLFILGYVKQFYLVKDRALRSNKRVAP